MIPPNKGQVQVVLRKTLEHLPEKPFVEIKNPRHGPITCDEAMYHAAHLAVAAMAGSKLKLGDLIKAILAERKRGDRSP